MENRVKTFKGQSHEKMYKIMTWIDRLGLNSGSVTVIKILKSPI
jgi:hypothetical protein